MVLLFVAWVSQQESFLFKEISFSLTQVFFSYLIITMFILWIKKKTSRSLIFFLTAIIISQVFFISENYLHPKNEFIIFHKSRKSIIGIRDDKTLTIHHNLESPNDETILINYKIGEHINTIKYDSLRNYYLVNQNKLLVIDSLNIYNIITFKPQFVLLINSPKVNLNRVIDSLKPELIISNGSNYKSYQKRWAKTCEKRKIPFHQTSKKGSFLINY